MYRGGFRGAAFGASKEREVMELLEAEGWVVARSAGSRGAADLVALRAGDQPHLIQVKGGDGPTFAKFGPAARRQLKNDAQKAGAVPLLCKWRSATKTWEFIPAEDWPADEAARSQPDYVVDEVDGCWLWQKGLNKDGYGTTMRGRRQWLMHRWYYEQHVGPIPEGMQLDHLCRVRCCVNPAHLEPVTNHENMLRGSRTRLTAGQVKEIRDSTESGRVLAERFGVGANYIWRIKRGDARKDVKYKLPEAA